ncbi:MAG: heavy metal translocating P-type ATPase [Elusimicrobia bacterium]|nr:heavy metal translocating P-type ATPase [Elusimicrobiota bacterium]
MGREPLNHVSTLRLLVGFALAAAVWIGSLAQLSPYSGLALGCLLAVVGARPFARGFMSSLAAGRADADMLVIFGVWAALAQATAAVFFSELLLPGARRPFFEVLGALVVFPALGRWSEARLTERGGEALWTLARRIPRTVRMESAGSEAMVPVVEASVGDRFRVMPGEYFPLDGRVAEGRSRVDESLWTGKASAIEKSSGSRVFGGSLNKSGALLVEVSRTSTQTRLARIVETVRSGLRAKAVVRGVADQIAASYAPGILIVAVIAALAWSWKGPEPRLERALTTLMHVLVAAVPWTLPLAVPAALAAGLRRARRMGLVVRNPAVLQVLATPDIIVVGKTGLLTEGRPEVASVRTFGGRTEAEVLALAYAAGFGAGHPYAEAVVRRAGAGTAASSIETHPGHGILARVGGREVLFGALPWLMENGVAFDGAPEADAAEGPDPRVGLSVDGVLAGVFILRDPVRPTAADDVATFARLGLEVVIVSGDSRASVEAVAAAVGVGRVYAGVLEEGKARVVAELQASGKRVAMLGEGFLDAPALSRADLGIAFEASGAPRRGSSDFDPSGFDLAAESADLVVRRRDLAGLLDAVRLAMRIRGVVRENLSLAFAPQIFILPIAAGVLGPSFGLVYHPSFSAVAAALSAAAITVNSIRRLRL